MSKPERRPVPGFDGYEISSDGRVFSVNQNPQWAKKRPTGELSRSHSHLGHLVVSFSKGGRTGHKKVSRLVLETFDRPPKEGESVHFKDGDIENCDLSNIEWEVKDKHAPKRKWHLRELEVLSKKDIKKIRELYLSRTISVKDIAQDYIVHKDVIFWVIRDLPKIKPFHNVDDYNLGEYDDEYEDDE